MDHADLNQLANIPNPYLLNTYEHVDMERNATHVTRVH